MKASKAMSRKAKEKNKSSSVLDDILQDETFFFIVGYTEWGFPYGVTWEEHEQMNNDESLFRTVLPVEERREESEPEGF